jgi:hypothetical protein
MGQDTDTSRTSTSNNSTTREKESAPGDEHIDSENVNVGDRDPFHVEERPSNKLSAVFENPLAGISREQLLRDVETFCNQYGLREYEDTFKKGALVSQNPEMAQELTELSEEEKEVLRRESTHKWSYPWQLYFLAGKCSDMAPVRCFPC